MAIPTVVRALGAHKLCFEKDTEPYAVSRDAAVTAAVQELGCDVSSLPFYILHKADENSSQCAAGDPTFMHCVATCFCPTDVI